MLEIIKKYAIILVPLLIAIYVLQTDAKNREQASTFDGVDVSEYITHLDDATIKLPDNWGKNREGSAKYLAGRTGIVTFFVGDGSTKWTKTDIVNVCDKIDLAAVYLEKCGMKYNQNVELIYNMEDLMHYEVYSGRLSDWEDINYTREVYNWIEKDVDCNALMRKYNLDGIAFVCVLNASGKSYAVPHIVEQDAANYYEVAYMYLFESEYRDKYENPASYAHELLHLFGAVDLYMYSQELTFSNTITEDLEDYIERTHPNEIMFTTYLNGQLALSTQIEQEFSNITAYEVGFLKYTDELEDYPQLKKAYPACFSEKDGF